MIQPWESLVSRSQRSIRCVWSADGIYKFSLCCNHISICCNLSFQPAATSACENGENLKLKHSAIINAQTFFSTGSSRVQADQNSLWIGMQIEVLHKKSAGTIYCMKFLLISKLFRCLHCISQLVLLRLWELWILVFGFFFLQQFSFQKRFCRSLIRVQRSLYCAIINS